MGSPRKRHKSLARESVRVLVPPPAPLPIRVIPSSHPEGLPRHPAGWPLSTNPLKDWLEDGPGTLVSSLPGPATRVLFSEPIDAIRPKEESP